MSCSKSSSAITILRNAWLRLKSRCMYYKIWILRNKERLRSWSTACKPIGRHFWHLFVKAELRRKECVSECVSSKYHKIRPKNFQCAPGISKAPYQLRERFTHVEVLVTPVTVCEGSAGKPLPVARGPLLPCMFCSRLLSRHSDVRDGPLCQGGRSPNDL